MRRREALKNRDITGGLLSQEDVKRIFKQRKNDAILAFDWTQIVTNQTGLIVIEELKNNVQKEINNRFNLQRTTE